MNKRLLVCCLNIQEGRRRDVISRITGVCSRHLIKSFVDPVFNRSNMTLCGESDDLVGIIDKISDIALSVIDINSADRLADRLMHHHIGVLDNIPIHPLHNTSLEDAGRTAVQISHCLRGKEIPTLVYGAADTQFGRSLVEVRKSTQFFKQGQVENRIAQSGHPTLGTSVVGAVPYVLSYNIVIDTEDSEMVAQFLPFVRNRQYGVQAMVYRNIHKGRHVTEIACNLNQPCRYEGSSQFILNTVRKLCNEQGLKLIDSYSTNPPFDMILDKFIRLNGQEPC